MFKRLYLPAEIRQSLAIYKTTKSLRKTASLTGISKSTIQRWSALGLSGIRKKRKCQRNKARDFDVIIHDIVSKNKLTTLLDIQSKFIKLNNKKISLASIHRSIQRSKFSWKKASIKCCYCSPDKLKEKTELFFSTIKDISFHQIACIDETGFLNVDSKAFGYSQKGERLQIRKTITKRLKRSCCMAITQNGITTFNIQTENFGKASFITFMKEFVQNNKTIRYIVMDNISFHHSKEIHDILDSHEMKAIYIPPYSPDCNPIENLFSIIKSHFRRLFHQGNSFEDSVAMAISTTVKAYKDLSHLYTHAFSRKL